VRVTNRELRRRIRKILNENQTLGASLKRAASQPAAYSNYPIYHEFHDNIEDPFVNQMVGLISGEANPGLTGEVGEFLLLTLLGSSISGCGNRVDTNNWTKVEFTTMPSGFGMISSRQSGGGAGDSYAIDMWCGTDPEDQSYNPSVPTISLEGKGVSQKFSASTSGSKTFQAANLHSKEEVTNSVGYAFSRLIKDASVPDMSSALRTYNETHHPATSTPGAPTLTAPNPGVLLDQFNIRSNNKLSSSSNKEFIVGGSKISILEYVYDYLKYAYINNNKNNSTKNPVSISATFSAYNLAIDPISYQIGMSVGSSNIGMSALNSFLQVYFVNYSPGIDTTDKSALENFYDTNFGVTGHGLTSSGPTGSVPADPGQYFANWHAGRSRLNYRRSRSASYTDAQMKADFKDYLFGAGNIIDQYIEYVTNFNPEIVLVGDMSPETLFTVTIESIAIDPATSKEKMTATITGDGVIGHSAGYTVPHAIVNFGKALGEDPTTTTRQFPIQRILSIAAQTNTTPYLVEQFGSVLKAIQDTAQTHIDNTNSLISVMTTAAAGGGVGSQDIDTNVDLARAIASLEVKMEVVKNVNGYLQKFYNDLYEPLPDIAGASGDNDKPKEYLAAYFEEYVEELDKLATFQSEKSFEKIVESFIEGIRSQLVDLPATYQSPTGTSARTIRNKTQLRAKLIQLRDYLQTVPVQNLGLNTATILSDLDAIIGADATSSLIKEGILLEFLKTQNRTEVVSKMEVVLTPVLENLNTLKVLVNKMKNISMLMGSPDILNEKILDVQIVAIDNIIALGNALTPPGKKVLSNLQQKNMRSESKTYENILKKLLYTAKKRQ
jgi:hypothetical protein